MADAPAAAAKPIAATALQLPNGRQLHVIVYRDVENTTELRAQLLAPGGGQGKRNVALINASLVSSEFQLRLAALKATEAAAGSMTTKTLHSELVFCLAGSPHVGESLKRLGIHDSGTPHVLVAMFDATDADVQGVAGLVKGTQVPLSQLPELSQEPSDMQQAYRITDEELAAAGGSLEDAVLAKMASQGLL